MNPFLPRELLEEILRTYLIIHWTDRYSDQPDFLTTAIQQQGGVPFRASELTEYHTSQIRQLLTLNFPHRTNIDQMLCSLNKMHDGNFISDSSHSEFIISITNNNTDWYDSFADEKVSLPYNDAVDTKGMTLSLPKITEGSYYYIDIFVPENA